MKFSKLFLVALVGVIIISCEKDDDFIQVPLGAYQNGVFILNEGTDVNASVSFLGSDLTTFEKDVYSRANGEDILGGYAQSMFFNGDNAYILSGASNTITVVNRYTFKIVAKIESGLNNPRYGVVKGNKAYVTNANAYYNKDSAPEGNTDDFVAVIDLTTNTVESKINLNTTGNRVVLYNNKIYTTEPYNSTKLSIINTDSNTLEAPIEIGTNADDIAEKEGVLYIVRSPWGVASTLVKVNLMSGVVENKDFPASQSGVGQLEIINNDMYYTVGTAIYKMNITALEFPTTPLFSSTAASIYGFAVRNDAIYVSDSGDYKTNSKAYIYSLTGDLIKELEVGVAPNGFYFND